MLSLEFENIVLSYGNRLILDNINFKIKGQIFGCLVQMVLVNQLFLIYNWIN